MWWSSKDSAPATDRTTPRAAGSRSLMAAACSRHRSKIARRAEEATMSRIRITVAALLAMIAMIVVVSQLATAQSSPAANQVPRTADGKPDFSGMWDNPKEQGAKGAATVFNREKMAPFVPGGDLLFYEPRTGDPRHDEPRAFCMPSGFPSAFLGPYPVQIIQTPQYLVMATEFMNVTRIIPLDGRPHKTDIEPTFYGEPNGRWDRDTLIIETTDCRRGSLDDWYYQNPKEYRMHTEALRTVERLRRIDRDTIAYEFTVDDPKIFTKPWSVDWVMKRHPEWEKSGLYEMVCNENNRCEGGNCRNNSK